MRLEDLLDLKKSTFKVPSIASSQSRLLAFLVLAYLIVCLAPATSVRALVRALRVHE